jgi:hypothetical protein
MPVGWQDPLEKPGDHDRIVAFLMLDSVVTMNGTFDWLKNAPVQEQSIAGSSKATEAALAQLVTSHPTGLPKEFIDFFRTLSLWRRIRSCTHCYLRLDAASVPIRGGLGRLVRFLSDSQDCKHWSLYISPCGTSHSVVATYRYSGSEFANERGGMPYPKDITICAASFEEFLYRFWMENELWYAVHNMGPMPVGGTEYLAHYCRVT